MVYDSMPLLSVEDRVLSIQVKVVKSPRTRNKAKSKSRRDE